MPDNTVLCTAGSDPAACMETDGLLESAWALSCATVALDKLAGSGFLG